MGTGRTNIEREEAFDTDMPAIHSLDLVIIFRKHSRTPFLKFIGKVKVRGTPVFKNGDHLKKILKTISLKQRDKHEID